MTFSEPNPDVRPVGEEPAEFIDPAEPSPTEPDGDDGDDRARDEAPAPVPERPPEAGGGPVGPLPHPGDYGASEDEQRRVVGRPREEAP